MQHVTSNNVASLCTFRPKRMLKVIILNRIKGTPNNVAKLQRIVGRIEPIRFLDDA